MQWKGIGESSLGGVDGESALGGVDFEKELKTIADGPQDQDLIATGDGEKEKVSNYLYRIIKRYLEIDLIINQRENPRLTDEQMSVLQDAVASAIKKYYIHVVKTKPETYRDNELEIDKKVATLTAQIEANRISYERASPGGYVRDGLNRELSTLTAKLDTEERKHKSAPKYYWAQTRQEAQKYAKVFWQVIKTWAQDQKNLQDIVVYIQALFNKHSINAQASLPQELQAKEQELESNRLALELCVIEEIAKSGDIDGLIDNYLGLAFLEPGTASSDNIGTVSPSSLVAIRLKTIEELKRLN